MYGTDTKAITFNWGNFVDPHSGVVLYRVAVGTELASHDVIHWRNVGLKTGEAAVVSVLATLLDAIFKIELLIS